MPILTEDEFQVILNKENEANAKIEEKNHELSKILKEKETVTTQKRRFVLFTLILTILFLFLLTMVFFQPHFFDLKKVNQLENNEVVVKKSTLENYQKQISVLESKASQYTNPLELQEFYAVQLGAFKKFNTPLSSADFKVVHNANFRDFNLYTLGIFKTEEEAEKLRKVISQLHFKDAFVGLYKNGKRVKSSY